MRKAFVLALLLYVSFQMMAVNFTQRNNSLKSIPLIITNCMNPNLSPKSYSEVDIPVGEKVYFKYKGKKPVLLTVAEDLKDKTLLVNELFAERIKELDP